MRNVGIRIVLSFARLSRASSAIGGHDANTEPRNTETASGVVRASEVSFAGGDDETVHGGKGGAIQYRSAVAARTTLPRLLRAGPMGTPEGTIREAVNDRQEGFRCTRTPVPMYPGTPRARGQ